MTWVCPTCSRRYPDSAIGLPETDDADEMTHCEVCSDGIERRPLLWALDRLCLWGELDGVETADPHVRGEAAASARVTIQELAQDVQTESGRNVE